MVHNKCFGVYNNAVDLSGHLMRDVFVKRVPPDFSTSRLEASGSEMVFEVNRDNLRSKSPSMVFESQKASIFFAPAAAWKERVPHLRSDRVATSSLYKVCHNCVLT